MNRWYYLIVLILAAVSCSDSDVCDQKIRVTLKVQFLAADEGNEKDTLLQYVTVYGIAREDSLLYDTAVNIQSIELPLDPASANLRFVIKIGSVSDTLNLNYGSSMQFVSYACGFSPVYHLNTIVFTYHNFDSIHIVNRTVDTENEENLKIFL